MLKSDIGAVSELAMLANPHAVKEEYTEFILEELRKNPDYSLVAVDDEEVVGYAQADIHNNHAVLEDIAVSSEHQGRNIGSSLLDNELKALKNKGIRVVVAEVHYKCAAAIPFYYKHNFRITGFVQDYFGVGHDTIILRLLLQ
jgi:ribosomal protein S18 acetylase RimI-like enzyme